MSREMIYLPSDEELNMFGISTSPEGWVIPLFYFGYPNIHLTIGIKNMKTKPGHQKVDIHLKRDDNGKILCKYYFEFSEDMIEKNYTAKLQTLVEKYITLVKKYTIKEKHLANKKLVCYDCMIDHFQKRYSINKKEEAKQSYIEMIALAKDKNLPQIAKREDCLHRRLIDLNTSKIYMNSAGGIFKLSQIEGLLYEMDKIFENAFPDEIALMERLSEDFENAMFKETSPLLYRFKTKKGFFI